MLTREDMKNINNRLRGTGKTVDEVAYQKLARQLGVTTSKAIKLVQEGRIIVRY